MKFCKNLLRVVEISDPEWAPYWTNYKMLKKLIKELPSLVPADDAAGGRRRAQRVDSDGSMDSSTVANPEQQHGDETTETAVAPAPIEAPSGANLEQRRKELNNNPGEKAFFKLLHAEFKKATHFFERAQQEFQIREERVHEGMVIMKQPNSIMVDEKWSMLAKSIFRLYKDLLLLETYAIMTFCSFSKILKKHDKVTGHETRVKFMSNVVNGANFTNYPNVLEMISRCERLYDEVSTRLVQEGKEALYEDERLFINMISRLNEQVLDSHGEDKPEGSESSRPRTKTGGPVAFPTQPQESAAVSTLRSMVEENDASAAAAHVSEADDVEARKRAAANFKPAAVKRSKRLSDSPKTTYGAM